MNFIGLCIYNLLECRNVKIDPITTIATYLWFPLHLIDVCYGNIYPCFLDNYYHKYKQCFVLSDRST